MPSIKKIDCCEPWFSLIKSGQKTVEGRRASSLYNSIKEGDIVIFKNEGEFFSAKVVKINKYVGKDPLTEYLQSESLSKTLPGIETLEEGRNVYLKFYTREQIASTGMLALHVQV